MRHVYMICGVPGSGKTWVAEQLRSSYDWMPHDDYIDKDYAAYIASRARQPGKKPILIECPFAERLLRQSLEKYQVAVCPVFIIEKPQVIFERYRKREGTHPDKSVMTRADTIINRAMEWKAFRGTAEQVLNYLKPKGDPA